MSTQFEKPLTKCVKVWYNIIGDPMWKSLVQIADDYAASADLLRKRLAEIRKQLKATDDPDEAFKLKRRIAELTPILTECNRMERRCRFYYSGNRKALGRYALEGVCDTQVSRRGKPAKEQNIPSVVKRAINDSNGNN